MQRINHRNPVLYLFFNVTKNPQKANFTIRISDGSPQQSNPNFSLIGDKFGLLFI